MKNIRTKLFESILLKSIKLKEKKNSNKKIVKK